MVMSYFERVRPHCKVWSFYTTGTQKKMMLLTLRVFVDTARLCLKLWVVTIILFMSRISSSSRLGNNPTRP